MNLLLYSMVYLVSLTTSPHFTNTPDSLGKQEVNHFLQKSKRQTVAGAIMLAAGLAGASTVLAIAVLSSLGDALIVIGSLGTYQPEKRSYTAPLLITGAIAFVGGVLLLAAARTRKKAKFLSVDVGVGSTSQLQQQTLKQYSYPELSLKFSF